MSRIRTLRLQQDAVELAQFLSGPAGKLVRVMGTEGRPPHKYRVQVSIPAVVGLAKDVSGQEVRGPFAVNNQHELEIEFHAGYPMRPPNVVFKTRVLHPNIYADGRLCWGVGDDTSWWRGGDAFGVLLERMMHILVGQPECTNPKSPANSDAVQPYIDHAHLFPLQEVRIPRPTKRRPLRIREIS